MFVMIGAFPLFRFILFLDDGRCIVDRHLSATQIRSNFPLNFRNFHTHGSWMALDYSIRLQSVVWIICLPLKSVAFPPNFRNLWMALDYYSIRL
jgi:lipid-A-disaccharide synthase-like uncharacterized protein